MFLYRRPWSVVCLITGRVCAVLESGVMSRGALEGVSSKAKLSTPGKKPWWQLPELVWAYDRPNREELQVPAWMSAKTYKTTRTYSNEECVTMGAQALQGGLLNRHPRGTGVAHRTLSPPWTPTGHLQLGLLTQLRCSTVVLRVYFPQKCAFPTSFSFSVVFIASGPGLFLW